jgi:polar amino acid transport system substrate-binding protein
MMRFIAQALGMGALRMGALLIVALMISPSLAKAACEKTVNWAWNDYRPYSYRATDGTVAGLDIDLTRTILQGADCSYAAQEIPAKRALKMLQAGEIDLVAAASVTAEREAYGYFSAPYRNERIVMFTRRDDAAIAAIKNFSDAVAAHMRIAAGNGGSYGADYDAARDRLLTDGLLTLTSSLEQRLQLLAGHRVDLVIEDEVAGASTARELGIAGQLQVVGIPLSDEPVRLLFSRKSISPDTMAAINDAIKTLQASPAYAAILAKHSSLDQ